MAAPARTASGSPSAASTAVSVDGLAPGKQSRSLWSDAWRQFRRNKLAMAGIVVLTILVLATVLGPFAWRTPKDAIDFAASKGPPSIAHPLGTNDLGQDMLARIIWGGRISLAVGVFVMLVQVIIGVVIGSLAGYFGNQTDSTALRIIVGVVIGGLTAYVAKFIPGFGILALRLGVGVVVGGLAGYASKWLEIDSILMRLTDLFLALPVLPMLFLMIYLFQDNMHTLFGPTLGTFLLIVFVIGALNWMTTARLVRAEFLSLKQKEFVEAARSIGADAPAIILKHILPNVLSPVIVAGSLAIGAAIITESTLSFLGIGFDPSTPTWGRLLSESRDFLDIAWWMAVGPAAVIFLTVLSINFIGDGLRDALDPRKSA